MSSDNPPPSTDQSLPDKLLSGFNSLFPWSKERVRPSKTTIDMKDVTYMMDMDGEGLCFHQFYKEQEAFKKQ